MEETFSANSIDELLVLLMLHGPCAVRVPGDTLWKSIPLPIPHSRPYIQLTKSGVLSRAFLSKLISHYERAAGAYVISDKGSRYIRGRYPDIDLKQLLIALRI